MAIKKTSVSTKSKTKPIGFLEEAPDVQSAARLAALLAILTTAVVGVAVAFVIVYVAIFPQTCHLTQTEVSAETSIEVILAMKGIMKEVCATRDIAGPLASIAAILAALGGSAWGALKERSIPTEPPTG